MRFLMKEERLRIFLVSLLCLLSLSFYVHIEVYVSLLRKILPKNTNLL